MPDLSMCYNRVVLLITALSCLLWAVRLTQPSPTQGWPCQWGHNTCSPFAKNFSLENRVKKCSTTGHLYNFPPSLFLILDQYPINMGAVFFSTMWIHLIRLELRPSARKLLYLFQKTVYLCSNLFSFYFFLLENNLLSHFWFLRGTPSQYPSIISNSQNVGLAKMFI